MSMSFVDYSGPVHTRGAGGSGPREDTLRLLAALVESTDRPGFKVIEGSSPDDYKKLSAKIRSVANANAMRVSIRLTEDDQVGFKATWDATHKAQLERDHGGDWPALEAAREYMSPAPKRRGRPPKARS